MKNLLLKKIINLFYFIDARQKKREILIFSYNFLKISKLEDFSP